MSTKRSEVIFSRAYQICNRYESGYGHGLKRDGLDLSRTPHQDTELGNAYQIGYEAGLKLAAPTQPADPVVGGEPTDQQIAAALKELREALESGSLSNDAAAANHPVAWMIEWNYRRSYYGHNAIADFREIDVDAKSTPLYAHPPVSAPSGMVLVPREPTVAMLAAGCDGSDRPISTRLAGKIYRAMIAAWESQESAK